MNQETQTLLQRFGRDTETINWVKAREITWEFSTPASSHHQGYVQRQIRTFKEVTSEIPGPGYHKVSQPTLIFLLLREKQNT